MRMRFITVVLALAVMGCDDRTPPVSGEPDGVAPAPTTAPAVERSATPASRAVSETFVSKPLGIIPFQALAPESWAVQSGIGSRIVLHGALPSGEIDVLLSTRPPLSPEAYTSLVQELKRSSSQPGNTKVNVSQRDNLTIVEKIETLSTPGKPPAETLVTYNVKYMLPGEKLEYQVYELNVADLTQDMFDADGELLRKVLLGLTYDPKSAEHFK